MVIASVPICQSVVSPLYHLNELTHFNKTDRNYSSLGPHDTYDIFEVMHSKVKVRQ